MGRRPCCDKIGLNKGAWTAEEDNKLINFILSNGNGQCCWRAVPKHAGLLRCGKSCRLRWTNYLRPDLKRGDLSESEERLVIELHAQLGNKWSKIASHIPGRTDNEIKNLWNTHIKKKLKKMGIDPVTHKPLAPDHDKDQEKDGLLLLEESTVANDDHSQEALEKTGQNMQEQDKGQEKDGSLLMEESPSTHDPLAKKINEMETDNGFSVDEVPLIEPHEFLVPTSDLPISAKISMSSVNSILEDPECLPSFEDWYTDNHGKSYDENTGFPFDDDFTDWVSLINDLDIIQSPPDITSTTAEEWS